MKAFLLVNLFSLISSTRCTSYFAGNFGSSEEIEVPAGTQQVNDPRIPKVNVDSGFVKLLETMTAVNMKLKYELGEKVAHLIHEMMAAERTAEAGKSADELYILYAADGWNIIKGSLGEKSEKQAIKIELMNIAIEHENIAFIRDLISKDVLLITYQMYGIAVRKASMYKTIASEQIVDAIANAAGCELGVVPNLSKKLDLGLANIRIFDYIEGHDFPNLERALKEGLNPNTRIINYGELLGISVMVQCYRCVALLIRFGSRVDVPIEYDVDLKNTAIGMEINTKGWTPLMVSVAFGDQRITKLLIKAGSRVSFIPHGREEERFHARTVARKIVDENLRFSILGMLKPSGSELVELISQTQGHEFLQAISSANVRLVDLFLLQSPSTGALKQNIALRRSDINPLITQVLDLESFIFTSL